jgi:hypothetical protein
MVGGLVEAITELTNERMKKIPFLSAIDLCSIPIVSAIFLFNSSSVISSST